METAQNAALAFMQRQQAAESAPAVMAPERKLRAVRTAKESPVTSHNGGNFVSVPGIAFTHKPGDFTAAQFMMVWRRAKDRNEQIQAINGFTGYDNKLAFSVNEYNATTKAKKELRPSHQLTVVQNKQETKTFVAGLPDNHFKRIADLMGREKMAAEALINHELAASNLTEGSIEQLTAVAMADVERERLVAIRFDLSLLIK